MTDRMLTEEARSWIGRMYPEQEFVATRDSIRRFAYATRETNPIHFDRNAARAAGYADVIASPMYYTVPRTAPYHTVPLDALGKDGIPQEDLPPIAFTRGMAGFSQVRWYANIVAGDTIRTAKKLADIYEKQGRSGPLVFLVFDFEFKRQSGELAVTERLARVLQ
jgi:hydroxyacyl-ACP dehydratase HTD2-like protein with hotdog domain